LSEPDFSGSSLPIFFYIGKKRIRKKNQYLGLQQKKTCYLAGGKNKLSALKKLD